MMQGAGPKLDLPRHPPLFGPWASVRAKSGPVADPEADLQAAR
jgi:hypothetical protein